MAGEKFMGLFRTCGNAVKKDELFLSAGFADFSLNFYKIMIALEIFFLLTGCYVGGKMEKRMDAGESRGDSIIVCGGKVSGIDDTRQKKIESYLASGEPEYGGSIRIHTDVEPPHLQPMLRPDAWIVRMVQGDVFEPLVKRNPVTYQFEGALAEKWEYDSSSGNYTFYLRKGVVWHDGKPFSSRDVIFTFNLLMSPMTDAVTMRNSLEEVDEWRVEGDYKVILHTTRRNFLFLQNLEGLPILPEHIYGTGDFNKHPFNRKPVGTGPFKFSKWIPDSRIEFERNDNYWGKKPFLRKVIYVIHRDKNVAFEMLKRGDIDLLYRVETSRFFQYDVDKELKRNFFRLTFKTPDYSFLMFNVRTPFFSDVRVRRAMAHLLDLEKIRATVFKCLATVVTGPWPPGHPAYDSKIQPYSYDPQKAEALLEEAGWKDEDGDGIREKNSKKFHFTFLIPIQSREIQRILSIYQQDLEKAGIKMDISLQDWSIYIDLCRKHRFEMAAMMWDMEWDNDLTGLFHSKSIEGGQNFPGWSNREADRLLEEGRKELDDEKRNSMFRRLHAILHDEVPYIFAFSPIETAFVRKNFRGPGLIAGVNWFDKIKIWVTPEGSLKNF